LGKSRGVPHFSRSVREVGTTMPRILITWFRPLSASRFMLPGMLCPSHCLPPLQKARKDGAASVEKMHAKNETRVGWASPQTTWPGLHAAALKAKSACVEPLSVLKIDNPSNPYNHVHADWRGIATPSKVCPSDWLR